MLCEVILSVVVPNVIMPSAECCYEAILSIVC
jgi:hypothetical protein